MAGLNFIPRRHRHRAQRGLALIEMALVLQLLVLLTFAVIEYGWMFYRQGQVVNAARQGVRVGVAGSGTNADIEAQVLDQMTRAGLADSYTLTVDPPDAGAMLTGDLLTVTVSVSYERITGFGLLPAPENLTVHATMSKEGPPPE